MTDSTLFDFSTILNCLETNIFCKTKIIFCFKPILNNAEFTFMENNSEKKIYFVVLKKKFPLFIEWSSKFVSDSVTMTTGLYNLTFVLARVQVKVRI